MTDQNLIATQIELDEISAMLAGLEMPDAAVADAAQAEFTPTDIIEPAEIDEIEAAVAAIESESVIEAPAETIDMAALDDEIENAVKELVRDEARSEAYAEQAGVAEMVLDGPSRLTSEPETPAKVIKPAKAPKEAKAAKSPAAPRMALGDLPPEAFVLDMTIGEDAAALAANKVAVLARRPGQVKVAEKFDNALLAIAAGRLPSTYTIDCYRVLKAGGETTSAGLAAALTSTSKKQDVSATYTIGTARSQAGQFMALSVALKIATRDGNRLVLNPDSLIAMALDGLLAA